ncbi:MAG: type IV pilus modification PilV family protein [Coriobacteriales bacterium]
MKERSLKGETLVETLAAILVCVCAAVALLTGTTVASRSNQTADARADEISQQVAACEAQEDSTGTTQVTIDGTSYTVDIYGGDDLLSYKLSSGGLG